MKFYLLLEKLLKEMNSMRRIDFKQLQPTIGEICDLLRVAKISTTTYENLKHEALGKGSEMITYDSGEPCREAVSKRIVTDLMNIIDCRVYMPIGADPWTAEEADRVRTIVETITVYVSRNKIQLAAERHAFFDDDGYHNLRYYVRCIERTAQEQKLTGKAAVNFNLKHFAMVNQQIGRSLGTFVMHSYFNQLESIIGENGTVCRMGGDNFVMLFDKEKLDEVLNFLGGAAIVYDVNTGDRIMVSARAGVFVVPDDFVYHDTGDIMDKIISAQSAAKSRGKEDIVFFSDDMIASKEKVMRVQRLFPLAIENEEFHVFYQPKIDINTGELIGAEALCRWFHDGMIVPPMEFIPVLEQGLEICRLDFYMLDHVCRDIRRWLDEGRAVVRVSVNLSRKHMMDVDLLKHIIEIIDNNNVPHEYIEIELTETTTDVEFRDLKRVVNGLQMAGVSTSVDDFGMGYSSLNLIKEIPWNVLKVDKSFLPVEEDDARSTRSVMFKYVVSMAREMGLECIAEGVETQSQVDVLRANDCELAQGYFFDKPLPIDDFEDRLLRHKYKVE